MNTAKMLRKIADEKNFISKESCEKIIEECSENIRKAFDEKIYKAAQDGAYNYGMDIEPYIYLAKVPSVGRDYVHELICRRVEKYYKGLGFKVRFCDDLCGRMYLTVQWGRGKEV